MATQKSLDDLLVDEHALNEELLTEVLAPYVRIGKDSGAFVPNDAFEELTSEQKTAVVLLYRKAAYELGLAEEEGAGPTTISEVSGIKLNTVKPKVRELDEKGIVQNDDGEYTIPTYNYDAAKRLIRDGEDER